MYRYLFDENKEKRANKKIYEKLSNMNEELFVKNIKDELLSKLVISKTKSIDPFLYNTLESNIKVLDFEFQNFKHNLKISQKRGQYERVPFDTFIEYVTSIESKITS